MELFLAKNTLAKLKCSNISILYAPKSPNYDAAKI